MINLTKRPLIVSAILFWAINILAILHGVENVILLSLVNFNILIHLVIWFGIGEFKDKSDEYLKCITLPLLFFLITLIIALAFSTIIRVIGSVVSGDIWIYSWFLLGALSLFIGDIYLLFSMFKSGSFNDSFFRKGNKRYTKILSVSWELSILISILIILSPVIYIWLDYLITDNENELRELVDDITKNIDNDIGKTNTLLNWFDRGKGKSENFANMYHRNLQKDNDILLNFGNVIFIYSKSPHFCLRGDKDMWVFCSRCGMCGEASLLFNTMGHYAGLDIRRVRCVGEDHDWNEVLIDDKWIILDPTAVKLPDKTGFNLSNRFMEEKVAGEWRSEGVLDNSGNVSYIFAEYYDDRPNEDITDRYSDTINVSIKCVDINNESLSNVTVSVYSYNSPKKYCYDRLLLSRDTDETGYCKFRLGDGEYQFTARLGKSKGILKESFIKSEYQYNRTISLL